MRLSNYTLSPTRINNAKAKDKLGWTPEVGFEELVTMMVDADMDLLSGKLRAIG